MIQELEERADKALNFLANTDKQHAELKARQTRLHELRKTIVAMGFESTQGAAEARRQHAHNTPELAEHINTMETADVEFHTLDNQRKTAVVVIDLYRTMSANQRRGA